MRRLKLLAKPSVNRAKNDGNCPAVNAAVLEAAVAELLLTHCRNVTPLLLASFAALRNENTRPGETKATVCCGLLIGKAWNGVTEMNIVICVGMRVEDVPSWLAFARTFVMRKVR